eukprot:9726813-Heterocapsa_arctica.AAC.1
MRSTRALPEDLTIITGEQSEILDGKILELAALWMNNKLRHIDEWLGFVRDRIRRARQQTWQRAATNRPHYKGVE